jgi:hypothetical protein
MWNVKTNVIRVIIGATGTISKSYRKYLSNMTVKHDINELQKTAILGTAHTLRKVLTSSTKDVTKEAAIDAYAMNCKYRIAETWFVSGIYM